MEVTLREGWTLIHGMGLGAAFLLAFAGGLAGLYSLKPEWLTSSGLIERIQRLRVGVVVMAVVAWLMVISGTYIAYPWYRANVPKDLAETVIDPATKNPKIDVLETLTPAQDKQLAGYPKFFLLSSERTANWHDFGMEWKEHVAWLAPILATMVAFLVLYYGKKMAYHPFIRRAAISLFVAAFFAAGVAGALGAFITKAAPVQ